jgi:hypothetical protein
MQQLQRQLVQCVERGVSARIEQATVCPQHCVCIYTLARRFKLVASSSTSSSTGLSNTSHMGWPGIYRGERFVVLWTCSLLLWRSSLASLESPTADPLVCHWMPHV